MNKKFWISLLYSILIFFAASAVLFNFNNKNKNNSLEEVTLADTTLTSRTYMN